MLDLSLMRGHKHFCRGEKPISDGHPLFIVTAVFLAEIVHERFLHVWQAIDINYAIIKWKCFLSNRFEFHYSSIIFI